MRAIFKPDDPKKLIIRDADANEVSLIQYYMNIINEGGTLKAETRYDLNDKPAGILFTAVPKESSEPLKEKVYKEVIIEKNVVEDNLVKISYKIDGAYEIINLDIVLFEELKRALQPNIKNINISFENNTFTIIGEIDNELNEEAVSYQVPEGLINLRDIETLEEKYYSGTFTFVYSGFGPGHSF